MKHQNTIFKVLLFSVYLLLFLLYCYLCSNFKGHGFDMLCWKRWAIYGVENGFGNIYNSRTDYLPLYHYVLFLWGKIHGGNPDAINQFTYQLRYFTLFCEFAGGLFLLKLVQEKYKNIYKSVAYSMIYFANLLLFYNSVVWGQVDGILASLAFISFFFAYKQKITGSILVFLLALNLKLQAIIFLPAIGLMLLPAMIEQFSWKNLSKWILVPSILQLLILTPFIISGDIDKMWSVVTNSMGKYPVVSMNAYNIWNLLLKGDLMTISDNLLFLKISYKHWGLFMFFASSFFALLYLLKYNYQKIRKKVVTLSLEKALIICSLIPLLFFFFNTQMHERYLHPSLIFLATYTILSKRPLPYIILNIAYFINLDTVLMQFNILNGCSRECCAVMYLITIIILFYDLYKSCLKLNV